LKPELVSVKVAPEW